MASGSVALEGASRTPIFRVALGGTSSPNAHSSIGGQGFRSLPLKSIISREPFAALIIPFQGKEGSLTSFLEVSDAAAPAARIINYC